jgi:hypothetical protein
MTQKIISEYQFQLVGKIKPITNSDGIITEFQPQSRYENKKNLKLNKYGSGSFCKFTIDKKYSKKTGVYLIFVDNHIRYVGECDDFFKRFGMGYGNISPRNCFEGGQSTNCRINSIILSELKLEKLVELYFLKSYNRFKVEHELILSLKPSWNKTSGKPSLITK